MDNENALTKLGDALARGFADGLAAAKNIDCRTAAGGIAFHIRVIALRSNAVLRVHDSRKRGDKQRRSALYREIDKLTRWRIKNGRV